MVAAREIFPLAMVFSVSYTHLDVYKRQVLRQSLLVDTTYVGCIGSRAKISGTTQRLLNDGIPQEKIDHIHWPIGLAIKAETPAEIAISIAGELIMVRAELAGQKPQWNHAWLG